MFFMIRCNKLVILICSLKLLFTTIYVGKCSLKFQKRLTSVFQKHNVAIKTEKRLLQQQKQMFGRI